MSKIVISFYLLLVSSTLLANDYYREKIEPILNKRCVVCHGCYTSPCNLKLDSFYGLLRGASQKDIYANRLINKLTPNRVLQDAIHHKTWQKKHKFYPVVARAGSSAQNQKNSIMFQMLNFRNFQDNGKKFKFDATGSRQCVSDMKEVESYKKKNNPLAGMPYGMEKLSGKEFNTLTSWIAAGSPGPLYADLPRLEAIDAVDLPIVNKWEELLNGTSKKEKLASRYLFEHLYAASNYFRPGRVFYRLVRSKTSAPNEIKEIATRRPYDFAGKKFYYRFKKVVETPVHKNHIPLDLGEQKFKRVKSLFFDSAWAVKGNLPTHRDSIAANPFIVFKDIPAKARYTFFLENAYYFIRTFIHGPVCNGQVATNVIRDHFWILFMDPDSDPTVNYGHFLKKYGKKLDIPAKNPNFPFYDDFAIKNLQYQNKHADLYEKAFPKGIKIGDIWNGDHVNKNAVLTVYRHYDSANVF